MLFCGQVSAQSNCDKLQRAIEYSGIGPALSGSVNLNQLPQNARDFLQKHFKNYIVTQCDHEFDDNSYEVKLSDGTDVEFDARGRWTEIEAGRINVLPVQLVKKLVPHKAYKELVSRKINTLVESVKRLKDGYKIEIKNAEYDEFIFSSDGKLIRVSR